MRIKGLHKTSLIDYPGKISAVIFTGGCNLRCHFCHNGLLATDDPSLDPIPADEVISFLKKRRSLLDAVTVSGGEPLVQEQLAGFLRAVRELDLAIKIDTNGFYPDHLKRLLDAGLADYVALDIKTSPDKYAALIGVDGHFDDVRASLEILRISGVEHELRMTCVPGFCDVEDIRAIGRSIGSCEVLYLQQFVSELSMNPAFTELTPHSVEHLRELKSEVLRFSRRCEIRGI